MLPSLCLPKWLLSLYDIYRTIPCMMQLRTWRIWTWLYRRFSGFSQQYQCEHVTVHDTHTGIKCKYCSINFIRLQTFSHFVVCCLYVYTLKTATEQTVVDCFSWISIRSIYISSALFSTFACFISLKTSQA